MEGVRQSHSSFPETNAKQMFETIGNLSFIQFHAHLMAVGEMKFIHLGPVEVFGHFMAQLKIYEAFFFNLWSFGQTEVLTQVASTTYHSHLPRCADE